MVRREDVCDILELTNPAVALQSLDDDEKKQTARLILMFGQSLEEASPLIISERLAYTVWSCVPR